jgi:hypothetical protein
MSLSEDFPQELFELFVLAIEGQISEEQFSNLEEQIVNSSSVRKCYLEFLSTYVGLTNLEAHTQIVQRDFNISSNVIDRKLWEALAEDERSAAGLEVQKVVEQKPPEQVLTTVKLEPTTRRISRLSLYTAITSTAALIFIMAYVFCNPRLAPPIVAKLTETVNAKWAAPLPLLEEGSDLRAESMKLLQGYAKIRLDKGTEVLLQGPVELKLETADRINLFEGKIYAHVPPHAAGFVVQTPHATVVDYGTEFAMAVSKSGITEAHVFTGRVELRSGPELIKHGPSTMLTKNNAARVDKTGNVSRMEARPHKFVKRLPSPYQLAVQQTKPKAYWRFEDSADRKFFNLSNRSAYRGEYFGPVQLKENGPSLGRGIRAHVLEFDGTSGYAFIPSITVQDPSNGAYSVVLWARLDEPGGQNIITSSDARGPDYNHSHQIRMDEKGQFEFYVFSSQDLEYTLTSEVIPTAGRWYHIAAILSSSGNMSLFIDGKLVGSSKMKGLPVKTYDRIYIASPAGNDPGAHWEEHGRKALKGAVAEVAVYSRMLSHQEISNLFSAAK